MSGDALDYLLDHPSEERDVFRDVDTNMDVPAGRKNTTAAQAIDSAFGLGIDEEVQISKRRKPVAKLDENRLLSQAGIPKLRRIAKERLRFKGKGHEYSDVARLLNIYQLWLDDLYPRAKFADGLAIIEKLGHKKRMQVMRKEWMSEAKSRKSLASGPTSGKQALAVEQPDSHTHEVLSNTTGTHDRSKTPIINDIDDELYSATPRKLVVNRQKGPRLDADESLFISDIEDDGSPSGDELDALLAGEDDQDRTNGSQNHIKPHNSIIGQEIEPIFDDEMEAMADIDSMW